MNEKFLFSCCYGLTRCVIVDSRVIISFEGNNMINLTLEVFAYALSIKDDIDNSCKLAFFQLLDFVDKSDVPVFRGILAKYRWYNSNIATSSTTLNDYLQGIEEKQNKLYYKFVADSDNKLCSIYNLVMEKIGKEYLSSGNNSVCLYNE